MGNLVRPRRLVMPLPEYIHLWGKNRGFQEIVRDALAYPARQTDIDTLYRGWDNSHNSVGFSWSRFSYIGNAAKEERVDPRDRFAGGTLYNSNIRYPAEFLTEQRFPVLTVGPELSVQALSDMFGDVIGSEEFIPSLKVTLPNFRVFWSGAIDPYYGVPYPTLAWTDDASVICKSARLLYLNRKQLTRWIQIQMPSVDFAQLGLVKINAMVNLNYNWPVLLVKVAMAVFRPPLLHPVNGGGSDQFVTPMFAEGSTVGKQLSSFNLLSEVLRYRQGEVMNDLVAAIVRNPVFRASVQSDFRYRDPRSPATSVEGKNSWFDMSVMDAVEIADMAFKVRKHTILLEDGSREQNALAPVLRSGESQEKLFD
jgi:hypothetical protein